MTKEKQKFIEPKIVSDYEGKILRIIDGDTYDIEIDEKVFNVRLWNTDTPESTQAYGQEVKEYLENTIEGRDIIFHFIEQGKYGRNVGKITVKDPVLGPLDLGLHLINKGYAVSMNIKDSQDPYYATQTRAFLLGRGMWANPDVITPSEFRKANKGKNSSLNHLAEKTEKKDPLTDFYQRQYENPYKKPSIPNKKNKKNTL